MSAYVGSWTCGMHDVQACSSIAPKLASHASVAGRSATTYHSLSPSSASSLCHRVIHSGACDGISLCQKPGLSTPSG